jgi:murein DD-endopeptidase MepM/ murein hydrolase activator NlpD
MTTPIRRSIPLLYALLAALLLACQPYLHPTDPDRAAEPIAWQCPTATPIPTEIIGYQPTPTPSGEAVPIFSTPLPTATPYIRTGSDYYQGQRVRVGPLILRVTGYRTRATTEADRALHLLDLQIENTTAEPVDLHVQGISLIRVIKRPDGRRIEGAWYPSQEAARAAGVSVVSGTWEPGTTTTTIAIAAPEGQAEAWGMPLVGSDQRRSGQTGDGYVWFRLQDDPQCPKQPGGPPHDPIASAPPAGTPAVGRGGYPVPRGTAISRGYGCHSFYTGVRGNCPKGMWWHDGVDFASAHGTPLFAVRDLTILYAGADTSTLDCSWINGSQPPHRGFGLYVKAQDAQGYTYWYGHASSFTARTGQQVTQGQQLARMGSTGCSTGPHLHFRVRLNGLDRNPFDVIGKP